MCAVSTRPGFTAAAATGADTEDWLPASTMAPSTVPWPTTRIVCPDQVNARKPLPYNLATIFNPAAVLLSAGIRRALRQRVHEHARPAEAPASLSGPSVGTDDAALGRRS